jgi:hypothetical protein
MSSGAVNRPEPGLWITVAAIPANAFLAYVLIYGAFGAPRLELFALMIYALMLVWRFHALTRRGYLPEIAGSG